MGEKLEKKYFNSRFSLPCSIWKKPQAENAKYLPLAYLVFSGYKKYFEHFFCIKDLNIFRLFFVRENSGVPPGRCIYKLNIFTTS